MIRGTTPTLKLKIVGIDLELLDTIYVTLQQGSVSVTKAGDEVTVLADDKMLEISLTEEETLKFIPKPVFIQMRAKTKDDKAIATNIQQCSMRDVLYQDEILGGDDE